MKIVVKGEMTLAALRQALFEKIVELEEEHAVHHSRGATLYVNPTDGDGQDVFPRNSGGRKLETMISKGPYRCAVDDE